MPSQAQCSRLDFVSDAWSLAFSPHQKENKMTPKASTKIFQQCLNPLCGTTLYFNLFFLSKIDVLIPEIAMEYSLSENCKRHPCPAGQFGGFGVHSYLFLRMMTTDY
jgi:hypothetical protein